MRREGRGRAWRSLSVRPLVFALLLLVPGVALADGPFDFRLAGRFVAMDASSAHFVLVNQTSDELVVTTYDGGNVHNAIERWDGTAWTSVGVGYCGLGEDGETVVAPGGRFEADAYVGNALGQYRIVLHATRRTASGATSDVEIRSDEFTHR